MTDNAQTYTQNTPEQLMQWYMDMGVDEALSEDTLDWFALSEQQAQRPEPPRQQKPLLSRNAPPPLQQKRAPAHNRSAPAPNYTALAPDNSINETREKVKAAKNLDELVEILHKFEGCGLKATAKNTCIYRGNPETDLMLIGEAPGRDEDIQGRPFVGRAGQLLDKMLASIERSEQNAYITNIVYWRPPGNRTPTPQEAQICLPFLERQIELIQPKIIVFLGGAAAKHMLNTTDGIMRLRGKWKSVDVNGQSIKAMATLHPAYLLRTPAGKKLAWKDFLAIKRQCAAMKDQ